MNVIIYGLPLKTFSVCALHSSQSLIFLFSWNDLLRIVYRGILWICLSVKQHELFSWIDALDGTWTLVLGQPIQTSNTYYFPPSDVSQKNTAVINKKVTLTGIRQDICTSLRRKKNCFSFTCLRRTIEVKLKFPSNFTFVWIIIYQPHAKNVGKKAFKAQM